MLFVAKDFRVMLLTRHIPISGISQSITTQLIYNSISQLNAELKKYDKAFAYWEKHREFETGNLESLYSIADCSEELGDYERAYEAFMKLVEIEIKDGCEVSAQWPLRRAEGCKAKMGKDS